MYMVWVYDEKNNLVDKFVSAQHSDAMTVLAVNYPASRYEIRKI